MAGGLKTKSCYYELLGLDRKCEVDEIKASYRKLALQMHPDKAQRNGMTVEEATQKFQHIQEAYSMLSNPQERAWYDAHREQILKGDDEPGEDPFKTRINLYKYFSTGCFSGFGDHLGGFFNVYAELFEAIDTEEEEWEDADEEHTAMPPFGSSTSEWADVSRFYKNWLEFCSRKAFGHADKWNPREAPNRQVRRAMEQENKKLRQTAKKDFNAEVRKLVGFVQKRDPRVERHQKDQLKENAEKSQREQESKVQRKAQEAREKLDRKEAARREEQERWAQIEAERARRRACGEALSEDESNNDDDDTEQIVYFCEITRKSFKSKKAFEQHLKSKKYLQMAAKLRRELERDLKAEAKAKAEAVASTDDSENDSDAKDTTSKAPFQPAPRSIPPDAKAEAKAKAKGKAKKAKAGKQADVEEDDSDDSDDFVSRFAACHANRAGKRSDSKEQQEKHVNDASDDSVDKIGTGGVQDEDDDQEDVETSDEEGVDAVQEVSHSNSKKAQKRAQQKAALLERRAEKESVQELVKNCRRANKLAKSPSPDTEATSGNVAKPEAKSKTSKPAVTSDTLVQCAVCGEDFPSKNKLFQHIKEQGHAAFKEEPQVGKKGRKKK